MVDLQSSAAVPNPPTATTPTGRPTGLRSRVRTVLVAAVSVLVLLLGLVYVFSPGDVAVDLSADEVSSAQPFDHDVTGEYSLASARLLARPQKHRWTETFYGKIDAKGVKISKVSLRIRGAERKTRGQAVTVKLKAKGTYRAIVHLRPGRYKLTLSLTVHKRHRTASLTRSIKNKKHYRVRGKVRPSGVLTLLPVSSY